MTETHSRQPAENANVEVVRSYTSRREHVLVQVRTPVELINSGWRSAVHELEGRVAKVLETDETSWREAVAVALDALAVGDFLAARHVLRHVTENSRGLGDGFYLLLVARYFAATGDIDRTRAEWQRVKAILHEKPVNASILRELADTAASIGERNDQAELLEAASRAPARDAAVDEFGLQVWSDLHVSASRGFALPDFGIRGLVQGLIGFVPDAIKNRVQLRPSMPSDWNTLEVDDLRCGDGTIGLRYLRDGATHTYRLIPGLGPVPFRVVFEPRVLAGHVSSVRLDGRPASLNLRKIGAVWECPVQIDLDTERIVAIDTGAADE